MRWYATQRIDIRPAEMKVLRSASAWRGVGGGRIVRLHQFAACCGPGQGRAARGWRTGTRRCHQAAPTAGCSGDGGAEMDRSALLDVRGSRRKSGRCPGELPHSGCIQRSATQRRRFQRKCYEHR